MDDLMSEDWQQPPKNKPPQTSTPTNASAFASNLANLRGSPALSQPQSGTASPLNISRPSSTLNGAPKPAASNSSDAFGNLLGNKSKLASSGSVSIQEKQRKLAEERRRQQEEQGKLWDNLATGSGRATPASTAAQSAQINGDDEEDFLAAFNKATPVDRSSHFPAPPSGTASGIVSGRSTPIHGASRTQQRQESGTSNGRLYDDEDDDDPFGLAELKQKAGAPSAPVKAQEQVDDDDILGDLGKPVTEKPPKQEVAMEVRQSLPLASGEDGNEDKAVAELVDMGFPVDNSKIALMETGGDVQAAVGWLLEQAHAQSKQKARDQSQPQSQPRRRSPTAPSRSPPRQRTNREDAPAWMRAEERRTAGPTRQDSRSPANGQGDKDPSQVASEFGSKFLKGANSLWKASQKQVAKTMRDFQESGSGTEGGDPTQPKWMREASAENSRASSQRREPESQKQKQRQANVTNEAAMLDAPRAEVLPQRPPRQTDSKVAVARDSPARGRSPIEQQKPQQLPQPKFMQQPSSSAPPRAPGQKLNRQVVEDEISQAYVSPARRKRPTPKPVDTQPEVDLFSPAPVKSVPPSSAMQRPAATRPSPAVTPRSQAPPRNIPSVSPTSLSSSAQHRKAGTEAFKRGDYASAHEAYTAAISPLPPTHPVLVVVLTNRALTGIKTGDAKTAVLDADKALQIIGPSQGVGENIDLGAGEGVKDMKEFFGKALMRKAEALEHMEKWNDAAAVWRQCVEVGVGGASAIQARNRCERAANPAPSSTAPAQKKAATSRGPPPAKGLGNSLQRPALSSVQSPEAVQKLRAANAAAERADDEKFALTDSVEAKLTAWKGSKSDNLRALLQSMDTVLWPEAGWKKVGMSDLVMPNKVKIVYMKAIGKVHPDKIPQNATTEQRMVSAAVFATLNEAWDKFKTDNNL